MAKKSSASSRPARRVSVSSTDISKRKWTKRELATVRRIAEAQAGGDDSGINYSDIPHLTEEQLAGMFRLRDRHKKIPVSLRLDQQVLAWLKAKGPGHLTRINDILVNLMEAEQRQAR